MNRTSVAYNWIGDYCTKGALSFDGLRDVEVHVVSWTRYFRLVDHNDLREFLNKHRNTRPIIPGGGRGWWKLNDLIWEHDELVLEEIATGARCRCNEMTLAGLKGHNRITVVTTDAPVPAIELGRLADTRPVTAAELLRLTSLTIADLQAERPTQYRDAAR